MCHALGDVVQRWPVEQTCAVNCKAEKIYAEQTQANHPSPHLSSWDTYLPVRKVSKDSKLATSQPSTSLPLLESDEPRQNSERGAEQPATSPISSSGSDGAEPEPELVKVVLAAQTHSQASVSSPTVRFYPPGTKLQVVRREGIWVRVSDPATQEHGWVLTQYLSSIDSPIPTQVATGSTAEPLTVKPASPKSNKRHRSAKPAIRTPVVVDMPQRASLEHASPETWDTLPMFDPPYQPSPAATVLQVAMN